MDASAAARTDANAEREAALCDCASAARVAAEVANLERAEAEAAVAHDRAATFAERRAGASRAEAAAREAAAAEEAARGTRDRRATKSQK